MNIQRPHKILVTRRAALGDVVMTTGVIRELKHKYGNTAEIHVSTDFPAIYSNNPHITALYTIKDTPASGWDVVYDLDDAYELNPDGHFVDTYYSRVFGNNHGLDQRMELFPTDAERAKVDEDLMYISSKFIAIHMRQWHWELKNIKPEVWFEMLIGLFEQTVDYKIVCVGGENDFAVDHPLVVNYNGRYNPAELKYFLDHASCFVGIDSGPFHCAGASSVPILALLNHVHPENILPYRNGIKGHDCHVIQAGVDCVGCHARQPVPVRSINCEKGNYPCNQTWNGRQIADKILEIVQ
jgi:ADP-heptose:LPS heptosyltransferase